MILAGEVAMAQKRNPIVLIHGLWMTALCWENWVNRYTASGYRVVAKSWPGMDIDINELRRDPTPIAHMGITEIVAIMKTSSVTLMRRPSSSAIPSVA